MLQSRNRFGGRENERKTKIDREKERERERDKEKSRKREGACASILLFAYLEGYMYLSSSKTPPPAHARDYV